MKQIMGINTQTFRYVCNECGCIFVSDEGIYRPTKIGNYDIYEDVCPCCGKKAEAFQKREK